MRKPKNQPVDILIGQRIQRRRNEIKMNQSALGHALGVTFQQIQKYEKATNKVSASRLLEIAAVLDCDLAYFLPNETRKPVDSEVDRFMASKDGILVARAFGRIKDAALRRMMAGFLDEMSRRVNVSGILQAAE